MNTGIMICGLNGTGKSTLGKSLAEKLRFHFIDHEDLFFPKTDPLSHYTFQRTRKEAETLLLREVNEHENFIFTAVKGDYGEEILKRYHYAVVIEVPKSIRLQRVKDRSFQTFGSRMLYGGDLYEQEQAFFDKVKSRMENEVETWVQTLHCPIIRVDGTKPIHENVNFIIEQIQGGDSIFGSIPKIV